MRDVTKVNFSLEHASMGLRKRMCIFQGYHHTESLGGKKNMFAQYLRWGTHGGSSSRSSLGDWFHRKLVFLARCPSIIVKNYLNHEQDRALLIPLLILRLWGYWGWLGTANMSTTEAQCPWLDLFPELLRTTFPTSYSDPYNGHYFLGTWYIFRDVQRGWIRDWWKPVFVWIPLCAWVMAPKTQIQVQVLYLGGDPNKHLEGCGEMRQVRERARKCSISINVPHG